MTPIDRFHLRQAVRTRETVIVNDGIIVWFIARGFVAVDFPKRTPVVTASLCSQCRSHHARGKAKCTRPAKRL